MRTTRCRHFDTTEGLSLARLVARSMLLRCSPQWGDITRISRIDMHSTSFEFVGWELALYTADHYRHVGRGPSLLVSQSVIEHTVLQWRSCN
jgi:hypothetical protein